MNDMILEDVASSYMFFFGGKLDQVPGFHGRGWEGDHWHFDECLSAGGVENLGISVTVNQSPCASQ